MSETIEITVKDLYGKKGVTKTMKVCEHDITAIRHEAHDGEVWGYFIEVNDERKFIDKETADLLSSLTGKSIVRNIWTTQRFEDTSDFSTWEQSCKSAGQGCAYLLIDARIIANESGEVRACPDVTTTVEEGGNGMGSSYGCGGSEWWETKDEALKSEILDFKRWILKQPYKEGATNEDRFLRDIRADNIRLFITGAGKQYLKMRGVDAEQVLKEFNSIPELMATDLDTTKQTVYEFVQGEVKRLKDEFVKVETAMRSKLGMSAEYSYKPPVCPDEFKDTPIMEVIALRETLRAKIEIMESVEEQFYQANRGEIVLTGDQIDEFVKLMGE